jgi:hypothetical protein
MNLTVLLVIFAIIIAVTLGEYRRVHRRRGGRRVVRILCGAAGIAILIALAVGTSATVPDCYQREEAKEIQVSVPTKPLPAAGGYRLLGYLLILRGEPWDPRPVHLTTFDHAVPEEGTGPFTLKHRGDGSTVTVECHVPSPPMRERPEGERPRDVRALLRLERKTFLTQAIHGTNTGSLSTRPIRAAHHRELLPSTHALSAFARTPDHVHTFVFLALAAPDDPLRRVSYREFEESFMNAAAFKNEGRTSESRDRSTAEVAGFRLAERIGIASLPLLLAALLLTQLSQRRSIAFAAMLALVILFSAVLDHMALNTHLSRLSDVEAPTAVRMTACRQAGSTFFYLDRSIAAIEDVAEKEGEPEALRRLARLTAHDLREGRIPF